MTASRSIASPSAAGHPGQQPGHGHGGQVGEPAQRSAGLEHGLHGAEAVHVADPDVRAHGGGAVPELEQGRFGGPALDLVGGVGDGPFAVGGQGGVPVGVGLGGGGQQQVAAEVHAGEGGGREAARGAHGLDPAAAEADVDGPAVGEAGPGEQQGGGLGGGRVPGPARGCAVLGGAVCGSVAADLAAAAAGEWDGCCGWLSDIALLRWLGRFLGPGRYLRPKITQRAQSLGCAAARFMEERNSRTGVVRVRLGARACALVASAAPTRRRPVGARSERREPAE